ncbi:MAG: RluA family pseudouridine synthase [Anaerolineales bacterium]|nr:RluA family pseudouridine synthase [Anaerolineales bacterium]MCW5854518.1 RluA family pseudouridine synthase [Anaerolineales bacterium]
MNSSPVTETLHDLQAPPDQPQRLDKFLAAALPQHSRARLQALIKAGQVRVAGQPVSKSSYPLEGGELVQVSVPAAQPTELIAEHIPLDIVYEDKQVIIVNKPAGLVVHPAAGHSVGTLVHAVLGHAPEIEGVGGELRPGLVHRLDKDTSGLIILAKNERAQRSLQKQFQERSVSKTYLALTDGQPRTPSGRIEAPIGRDPQQRKRMAVMRAGKGREAVSEYRTLETFPDHSLLEVDLLTGRTHQIRVHLAFIGCPVAGDRVYGRRKASLPLERHFLHAARLQIILPGKRTPQQFEAPLPAELQAVLDELRAAGRKGA